MSSHSRLLLIPWALGCVLLVSVACRDDVGVVLDTNPPGCDSIVCVPVHDTVFDTTIVTDTLIDSIPFPVHDTLRIYCWAEHPTRAERRVIFRCDDGYHGPRN